MKAHSQDHDRWFKELITTFFEEFILAFFPKVYEHIDFSNSRFLSEEVYTDIIKGEKRRVDLLIETRLKDEDAIIIIHVEPQSYYEPEFSDRMFIYFSRLYEKYRCTIVPIAIFSYDKEKVESDRFKMKTPFLDILNFHFFTLQLRNLNWRDFLSYPNPVATALLCKMGYDKTERVQVKK